MLFLDQYGVDPADNRQNGMGTPHYTDFHKAMSGPHRQDEPEGQPDLLHVDHSDMADVVCPYVRMVCGQSQYTCTHTVPGIFQHL